MPVQFIHCEDYARKSASFRKTTGFIFGEVSRQPSMCDHIAGAKPPVIVYGASVEDAERLHDAKVIDATTQVKGGRQRKIRADQKTLASIVISHPYLLEAAKDDPKMMAELRSYEQNSINWLKDTYGKDLVSVIRHDDEPHAHWHALVIPLSDPEFKASNLHPGKAAKAKVMADASLKNLDSKLLNKKGDMAYKKAMRAFQDSFYQKVSKPAGLTRLGPEGRRLTRDEWHREKTQAKALQEVKREAEEYEIETAGDVVELRDENKRLEMRVAELEEALAKGTAVVTSDSDDQGAPANTYVIDFFRKLEANQLQMNDVKPDGKALPENKIEAVGRTPVVELEPSEDKPKLPPFRRPAYLPPRKSELVEQDNQKTDSVEMHKPKSATVEKLQEAKHAYAPSQIASETDDDDWYEVQEANRAREEHERFLENKSFTFYDLCKSPEADIFLAERTRVKAAAEGENSAQSKTRSAGQEPSNVTKHNVKEQSQPNVVEETEDHSQARKFLDKVLSPLRRLGQDPDGTGSSPLTATEQEQAPDTCDGNTKPELPTMRYTRTYKVDNAKLGLPPGHDHLARVRRKPKTTPDQKPDEDTPEYTPRRPSP